MNNALKRIGLLPFSIVDRLRYRDESLLTHAARSQLTPDAKVRLAKEVIFDRLATRDPFEWHRFETYVNAVSFNSPLSNRFASNLVRNFSLYESQVGQDCFIDTILGGKTGGTFVEIGVGEGRRISNSYFFEKHRGWTGVLCEPARVFHESIRKSRSSTLVTDAVFERTGDQVQFNEIIGKEELSTIAGQAITDSHDRRNARTYTVSTTSFDDLYDRYLDGRAIDYLSIDTEGSELEIIKSIDLGRIEISAISVEHNYDRAKRRALTEHLNRHGFAEVLEGVFEIDSMFVSERCALSD